MSCPDHPTSNLEDAFSSNFPNYVPPTSPDHAEFDESNANVLERFYTSAGNPVKEILLKLNLPDHRILKDGGEGHHMLGATALEYDQSLQAGSSSTHNMIYGDRDIVAERLTALEYDQSLQAGSSSTHNMIYGDRDIVAERLVADYFWGNTLGDKELSSGGTKLNSIFITAEKTEEGMVDSQPMEEEIQGTDARGVGTETHGARPTSQDKSYAKKTYLCRLMIKELRASVLARGFLNTDSPLNLLARPTLTSKLAPPVKVTGPPPRTKNRLLKEVKKAGRQEHNQEESKKGKVQVQGEKVRIPRNKLELRTPRKVTSSAVAEQEEWPMPVWCKMSRQTLGSVGDWSVPHKEIGNACPDVVWRSVKSRNRKQDIGILDGIWEMCILVSPGETFHRYQTVPRLEGNS
ncbi:hypothetical protein Tco_0215227 [Tanacetum coccineum]